MKMKKWLAFFTVLGMLLSIVPAAAAAEAAEGVCGDDLTWTLDENGTLTISGSGAMDDYGWSSGLQTPWDDDEVLALVVQEGVTTIGEQAFERCENLVSAALPESLTSIGGWAFWSCESLDGYVSVYSNVTYIGTQAFDSCYALDGIVVAEGNTAYASKDGVLYNADMTTLIQYPNGKADEEYTMPDSVLTFESYCFWECSKLKKLNIGAGLETVDKYNPIEFGSSLRYITVDASNTKFSSIDGVLTDKAEKELMAVPRAYQCTDGVYTIPDGIETIRNGAFYRNTTIEKVILSDTITTLGYYSFNNMMSLKELDLAKVQVLNNGWLDTCNVGSITIPATVTFFGKYYDTYGDIREFHFKGDAPQFDQDAFKDNKVTAYYPADNSTWTEDVRQNYGGNVTWVPYDGKCVHKYAETVQAPTCTEQGYTIHTCSLCGDSYVDAYVEPKGHTFGGWYDVPGSEDNLECRKCATCGHYEYRDGKHTTHTYTDVVTPPTCTEQGYTTHTCTLCGDSYVDSYVDAPGHSYGDWNTVTEATCTVSGVERRVCANCDDSEIRITEKTDHSYTSTVTAPTCTEQGCTTHTCTACGHTYADSYITATGHSYVSVVTPPTATERGYTTHTCSVCGDSYVDTYVDPTEQNYETLVTVTGNIVNFRSGPGTNYTKLGTVYRGYQLVITEIKNVNGVLWGKFAYGWICLTYTNYESAVQNPDDQIIATGVVRTNGSLLIRAEASTASTVVGRLASGTHVNIYEIKTVGTMTWGRISAGWICLNYVDYAVVNPTPGTGGDTGSGQQPDNSGTVTGVVTASALCIRRGAGTNYQAVGVLYRGDAVNVLRQVTVNGVAWGQIDKGWICMTYVQVTSAAPETGEPDTGGGSTEGTDNAVTGMVTASSLCVRKGPGTGYAAVTTLPRGTVVTVLYQTLVNGTVWGRIENGWICMSYVKVTSGGDVVIFTGMVTASRLMIRSAPGTANTIVGFYANGTVVKILEVTTVGGTLWGRTDKGWISMKYVK